jgi:hypothetical protein
MLSPSTNQFQYIPNGYFSDCFLSLTKTFKNEGKKILCCGGTKTNNEIEYNQIITFL